MIKAIPVADYFLAQVICQLALTNTQLRTDTDQLTINKLALVGYHCIIFLVNAAEAAVVLAVPY